MSDTIFKGDQITSLTDLENYIKTGCPILIGKELIQADSVLTKPLKSLIDALDKRRVYKARDLEHFNNGITVGELISILKKFEPTCSVKITGAYGSDTEQIGGFRLEPGLLTIMTDLCSG